MKDEQKDMVLDFIIDQITVAAEQIVIIDERLRRLRMTISVINEIIRDHVNPGQETGV